MIAADFTVFVTKLDNINNPNFILWLVSTTPTSEHILKHLFPIKLLAIQGRTVYS